MIASESEPKPGYAHHRGIPYGYAVHRDGSVAADEDEQAVLLRLQLWREAGYSYSVIAASLNGAGFRTRAESGWTKAALSWLWRNGRRAADGVILEPDPIRILWIQGMSQDILIRPVSCIPIRMIRLCLGYTTAYSCSSSSA